MVPVSRFRGDTFFIVEDFFLFFKIEEDIKRDIGVPFPGCVLYITSLVPRFILFCRCKFPSEAS